MCNSTRLRNKILYKINNISLIEILVTRLKNSKKLNKVIVATSKHSSNNKLSNILKKNKILFFRGSENNVLKRYYQAAKKFKLDIIVRVTGDSPLADSKVIDKYIDFFCEHCIIVIYVKHD